MSGWVKGGLLLATASGERACTHAMLPTPFASDGRLEIYFAACDPDLRGRIYAVDLVDEAPVPKRAGETRLVLDIGNPGDFDADGVNPCQIVRRGDHLLLYYIGWQRDSGAVPYRLFVGLAISRDQGATYTKVSREPILPAIAGEEYFRTAAHIYPTPSGWAALYIGGNEFITGSDGKRLPVYSLRRTTSPDGMTWSAPGEQLMSPDRANGEIGFGRPWLWHDDRGAPVLMISVRTERGYNLVEYGLFEEGQGNRARRRTIVECSADGWDSEMTCFGAPCVGQTREWLFYNGNGFGRTGFGVASRQVIRPTGAPVDRLIAELL